MEPKIIYQDEFLLVIDKPSGWIVNESETVGNNPVVQTWLHKNFTYPLLKQKIFRSGIVHRLDKETSGILLVAKKEDIFGNLQSQFKNREVQKVYFALVHGKLEPKVGEIKASVGRLPWRRDRFGVLPAGREATTNYNVLNYFKNNKDFFSLVEFQPKTGRTHQIRIHAKYLGYPIVSDEFYAGRKTAKRDRMWCKRLFLHAAKITFIHPESNKSVTFSSELSDDLRSALASLEPLH